jgi:hypothetical protein
LRRTLGALLLATVAVLLAPQTGLAHKGVPGYVSTVTAVSPPPPGVTVSVLDGSDRLVLENDGVDEIVIEGYDGEPYLRFTPDGVFRNTNSPATYLNEDRYGNVALPDNADASAAPEWELVSSRGRYEWHDHRIHWMSEIPPPQVRAAPDEKQRVFEWEVPGTANGEPFVVAGTLDYEPPASSRPALIYLALPLVALAIAGGAWMTIRRRRRS